MMGMLNEDCTFTGNSMDFNDDDIDRVRRHSLGHYCLRIDEVRTLNSNL